MSERIPESRESLPSVEASESLAQPKSPEAQAELSEQDKVQRHEQAGEARAKLEQQPEPQASIAESETRPAHHPTRLDKEASYKHTMSSLQQKLSPVSRTFSRAIHSPVIEKSSEVLGATIARPSVTLGATTTAAIVGGVAYFTARSYGYPLSGSELIFCLLVGGVIGYIVELVSKLLRKTKA